MAPRRLGRSSKSTALDIDLDFLFPVWTEVTWTTGGAVGGAVTSLSLLVMVFSLFSLIVVILATRKTKLKKKKKEEKRNEMEWTILISTSSFLVTKIFSNR